MKRFLSYVFLLVVISTSGYFIYQKSLDPCQKTLEYSIGRFDTQFGISEEEFKNYIATSETIWEKTIGRNIFVYKPNASFKINLIYDQRQLATIQKQKTEFGLSAVENIFKKLDSEFETFKNQYDQKVAVYEGALATYKKRKAVYDTEVAKVNSKGGASGNQYNILNTERQYLNSEANRLNAETVSINEMTNELNALLKERNIKASEYNKITEEYNKKYNGGTEFNQAEYTGNSINVYQFGNKKDLILALTHEFGHALGMNHTDNPKSVMYYLSGTNTEISPTLSVEDLAELKKVCKFP
jgi:hypothetical protein